MECSFWQFDFLLLLESEVYDKANVYTAECAKQINRVFPS
jgi:hypothetical protein